MKKFSLILMTLMMSLTVFATEFTGKILNLNQDEEGMKVVLQEDSVNTAAAVLLYLNSKSKDFAQTIADLNHAKESAAKVRITTTDDSLAQIIKIQVLNK
jgi:hypothetical protein